MQVPYPTKQHRKCASQIWHSILSTDSTKYKLNQLLKHDKMKKIKTYKYLNWLLISSQGVRWSRDSRLLEWIFTLRSQY